MEEALRSPSLGFYPQVPAGQETDPGQLEREYQNNYQTYLDRTRLTDQDYRVILEEGLLRFRLHALLSQNIEDPQEQVEVEWIRLDPESTVSAEGVKERLEIQDFATVANDVGIAQGFADANGYVGWVPPPGFPRPGWIALR